MPCLATAEHLSCTACSLHLTRTLVVPGHGDYNATIALVGEAPGATEDKEGRPFVGRAGQLLNGLLVEAGLCRVVSIGEVDACIRHDAQAFQEGWGRSRNRLHFVSGLCNTHAGIVAQLSLDGALRLGTEASGARPSLHPDIRQASGMSADSATVLHGPQIGSLPKAAVPGVEEQDQYSIPLTTEHVGLTDSSRDADGESEYSPHRQQSPQDMQASLSCVYCSALHQACQPIYLDNVVHCRPLSNNLREYPDAITRCPDLWLKPELASMPNLRCIVALGATAGTLWFPGMKAGELATMARVLSSGVIVVGSYHPSYVLRGGGQWVSDSIIDSLRRAMMYAAIANKMNEEGQEWTKT